MKKSKFYRSMAAAAVSVFAIGGLTFVSCDKYDDTELRNSIDDLNSRVESLEEMVTALQGDVDAINNLLESGKVIQSITPNEDGTEYTITYVGDNTQADVIKVGSGNPVVTVIEEGETYYWGLVDEDGNASHIIGSDNKIPVADAAPVMQVTEDGKLQISMDNGSLWTDTGVDVNDIATFKSVEIGDGEVIFTLQDDTKFSVSMTTELTCEFISGKTLFEYGDEKKLSINIGGFYNYEIAAPAGWTAVLSGNVVIVNAPYSAEEGAASGEIIVRVYDNKGAVIMDKVSVAINDGTSTILMEFQESLIGGTVRLSAMGSSAFCGVMPVSEFTAEKAAAAATSEMGLAEGEKGQYLHSLTDFDQETYMMVGTIAFTDMVENPVEGETYVIWYAEQPWDADVVNASDILTCLITYMPSVEVSVDNIVFNDADIAVTPAGNTEYYYGITEAEAFYPDMILNRIAPRYGDPLESVIGPVSVRFSEVAETSYISIVPGAEYIVWTLIKNPDPDYTGYVAEDIQTKTFTLNELTIGGGSAQVTLGEVQTTTTSVSVSFTAPESYFNIYGRYMSDTEYQELAGDDAIVARLLEENSILNIQMINESDLASDTKGWIVVVVADNEGHTGPLAKVEANTIPVVRNEVIKIDGSVDNIGYDAANGRMNIPLEITGDGAASIIYYNSVPSDDYRYNGDIEAICAAVPTNYTSNPFSMVSIDEFEAAGNILQLSCWSYQANYSLRFVAFVLDSEGHVTNDYVTFDYTPSEHPVTE